MIGELHAQGRRQELQRLRIERAKKLLAPAARVLQPETRKAFLDQVELCPAHPGKNYGREVEQKNERGKISLGHLKEQARLHNVSSKVKIVASSRHISGIAGKAQVHDGRHQP